MPGQTSSVVLPGHYFDDTIAANFWKYTLGTHVCRRYGFGSHYSKEASVVCRGRQTLFSISDILSQQAIQKESAVSRMLHSCCAHFIVHCIGERIASAFRNPWALCCFPLHNQLAWTFCCCTTDLCGATSALYSWANWASLWMQLPFLFRGRHCNHLCSYGQVNDFLIWTYLFLEKTWQLLCHL